MIGHLNLHQTDMYSMFNDIAAYFTSVAI